MLPKIFLLKITSSCNSNRCVVDLPLTFGKQICGPQSAIWLIGLGENISKNTSNIFGGNYVMVSRVVSGVVEVVERKPSNRYKLPPKLIQIGFTSKKTSRALITNKPLSLRRSKSPLVVKCRQNISGAVLYSYFTAILYLLRVHWG